MFPQIIFLCGSVVWKDTILDVLDGENIKTKSNFFLEFLKLCRIVAAGIENCDKCFRCISDFPKLCENFYHVYAAAYMF